MSSEEHNIQTEQEEFSNLFREAFDASLLPEHGPQSPLNLTFLEKEKKRLGYRERLLKIVAVILIIFITSFSMTVWICGSPSEAFDHPVQMIMKRLSNGRYTTNPDSSGSEEKSKTIMIKDSSKIKSAQKLMPDLFVPVYIPEGWEFESLLVERKTNNVNLAKFKYSKGDDSSILIDEFYGDSLIHNIINVDEEIDLNDKKYYYYFDETIGSRVMVFYENNVYVQIVAPLEKDILLQIADQMTHFTSSAE